MEIQDNYKVLIGERLRISRKNAKFTQEEIAEKLNISQKHYSEVERGISGLSVKNLILISDLYQVSLDFLLKGIQTKERTPENSVITELFDSVSIYTQKQMLCLLQIAQDIEKHAGEST